MPAPPGDLFPRQSISPARGRWLGNSSPCDVRRPVLGMGQDCGFMPTGTLEVVP